jgi:hypothetical protein
MDVTFTERLARMIAHYSVHNGGRLPAAIVVNPSDLEIAREIVRELDLSLAVIGNRGAMSGEAWLQVPVQKHDETRKSQIVDAEPVAHTYW